MDWNRLRETWQRDAAAVGPIEEATAVRERDERLRAAVRRRDRIETVMALLVAPVFVAIAWHAGARGATGVAFFAGFIAAWALYVPVHLWRTRQSLPGLHPEQPALDYLRQEHAAMLAQARQSSRIWLWYLGPCAFGVIGMTFAARGPVLPAFVYTAIVLAFCALLGWANRRASVQFLAHAERIAGQLSQLAEESDR